jgi:hypothetical protein
MFTTCQLKTTSQLRSLSDEYVQRPPKGLRSFYSCAIEWDNIKLIIAYHVNYDYYKIDRNKQSKIAVHETDILNSHFTELFIDNHASRL